MHAADVVKRVRSFKVGQTYAQKFTSPDGTVTAQGIFVDTNPFITANILPPDKAVSWEPPA